MSYADQVKRNIAKFNEENETPQPYDWRAEYQRELEEEQQDFYGGSRYSSYDYSKGYSASSAFSKWGGGWSSGKDEHEKAAKALREVARTANVVRGRFGVGKDKELIVQWSDGTKKNLQAGNQKSTIFLSPDIINEAKTAKPDWTDDQLNDALIGEGLLGAGLKKTCSEKTAAEFQAIPATKKKDIIRNFWQTSETVKATHEVLDDYRGFAPYFKAVREYRTADNFREKLETEVTSSKPSSSIASKLWAWNTLHHDKAIDVPEEYKEAMEYADKQMKKTQTSEERLLASRRIASDFFKRFQEEDDQPEPNSGGEGNSKDQLGDVVSNQVDAALGNDKVDCEDGGNQADTGIRVEIKHEKHFLRARDPYGVVNNRDKEYANIVKEAAPMIAQLKHKMRFRALKKSRFETACRSGEIDENALFMLGVDKQDDKLFMRREALEQTHIGITILVDESSSMGSNQDNGVHGRVYHARMLAVTLAEVLTCYEGIHLQILGHYSNNAVHINHYFSPENTKAKESIAFMNGIGGTDEGTAIAAAAKLAVEHFRPKNVARNILISISDGGTNVQEAKRQVDRAMRSGVEVYGCGICNPYNTTTGMQLYGQGRFVILKDARAANVLGSFISKVATTVR